MARLSLPAMPQRVAPQPAVHLLGLPRDTRDFPVPAEAPWDDDGVPQQAKVNSVIKLVLAAYRACPVCGFTLRRDEPVWRIHDQYSRGATHEEITSTRPIYELDVPGHLVCMLYSALVCPFWRSPGGRLDPGVARFSDGRRGDEPSIMGFGDYSVIVDKTRPFDGPASQEFTQIYQDYDREIVFRDPLTDLGDRYEEERRRCGKRYVEKKRRHYGPDFGGRPRLDRELRQIMGYMSARGPHEILDNTRGVFKSGFM